MKHGAWLLAALAAACGSGNGATPDASSTTDSASSDSNVPLVPATQFAAQAMNFAVPSSGLSDGFGLQTSFASYRYWTTTDLDGDGFLDVVHSADTAFTQRVW